MVDIGIIFKDLAPWNTIGLNSVGVNSSKNFKEIPWYVNWTKAEEKTESFPVTFAKPLRHWKTKLQFNVNCAYRCKKSSTILENQINQIEKSREKLPSPVGFYSRMSWMVHYGNSINIKSTEKNDIITTKTFFISERIVDSHTVVRNDTEK